VEFDSFEVVLVGDLVGVIVELDTEHQQEGKKAEIEFEDLVADWKANNKMGADFVMEVVVKERQAAAAW